MTNHYAVLDVKRTATPHEVKAARRAKAREAHPDRGGSAERFAAVQRAYEVLSDEAQRAEWEASYAAAARLCPDFRMHHPTPSPRPPRLHPDHRQETRLGQTAPDLPREPPVLCRSYLRFSMGLR